MKKVIVSVMVVAVSVLFVSAVFATEVTKEKSSTMTTPGGVEITKEKGTVETNVGEGTYKKKETVKGDTTVTKGKAVVKEGPEGYRSKYTAKVLQIQENDPANDSDNTVTFITTKGEKMTMKLHKNIKVNKLSGYKDKQVVFSTYAPTAAQLARDGIIEDFQEVK